MTDFLKDEEFIKLEKEFKFLSRARSRHGEVENLSYIVLDLETTGLDPSADEIIEIGAIKIENGQIKDIFNKLVKPTRDVSKIITDITGITPEMLNDELPLKPVLTQFAEYMDDMMLVAHNSDFDISFLRNAFKKHLNREINNFVVCTLLISRDILPNLDNHKLHTIGTYFGLPVVNRHRAIGDAELTYLVWQKLAAKLKDRKIETKHDLENYMASLTGTKSDAVPF